MAKKYNWAGPNKYITKSINKYCYSANKPPFALMIDGPRGCGKTWLIKRFFEEKTQNSAAHTHTSVIYVSLYGIQNSEDITASIYTAMHPVFNTKIGEFGKVVFRGLLKNTLKINLQNLNNKTEIAEFLGISTKKKNFNKHTMIKDRILVFDDIERAKMPVSDILSFIQPLVETYENRVILITNEKEIAADNEEERYRYEYLKEKTIYLTLCTKADVKNAWKDSLSRVPTTSFTRFLLKNERKFVSFIEGTGIDNLRIMSFFMAFGEDLFLFFKKNYNIKAHDHELIDIFYLLYGLLIEKCIHKRSLSQICDILDFNLDAGIHTHPEQPHIKNEAYTEEEKTYLAIGSKPHFQRSQIYYNLYPILYKMIEDGTLNKAALKKVASYFFQNIEAPSWQQLLVYEYENDLKDKGRKLIHNFINDFKNNIADNDEEVLHICDTYIMLHKLGINKEDPTHELKKYILRYFNTLTLNENDLKHPPQHLSGHQVSNYVSMEQDPEIFLNIKKFFMQEKEEFLRKNIPPLLKDIIKHENAAFLIHGIQHQYPYLREMPYLHMISPSVFAKKLERQTAMSQYLICAALNRRFQNTQHALHPLSAEKKWFEDLMNDLTATLTAPSTDPLYREVLRRNIAILQQA